MKVLQFIATYMKREQTLSVKYALRLKDVVVTNFRRDTSNKVKLACIKPLKRVVLLDAFSASDLQVDDITRHFFELAVKHSKVSGGLKVGTLVAFYWHCKIVASV